MNKLILLVVFFMFMTGCTVSQVSIAPSTNLQNVSKSVSVNVVGSNIDKEILDRLSRELKGRLIVSGFELDKEVENIINLNVDVTEFTPGNAALRMTFGFGAGRGSLVYTAEYIGKSGEILAKMDGQERFTGLEVGHNSEYGAFATLGGEETAKEVLIKETAKHIVQLALYQ